MLLNLTEIDSLPALTAKLDSLGKIVWASKLFLKTFKLSYEAGDAYFQKLFPYANAELLASLVNGETFTHKIAWSNGNGQMETYSLSLSKCIDKNNAFFWLIVTNETELEREKKVKTILLNISRTEVFCKDLKSFFNGIQAELNNLFEAQNMFVVLWDKMRRSLRLTYFKDHFDTFENFPPGKTLSSYLIESRKSLLLNEKDIQELHTDGVIDIVGSPAKSWMGTPLLIDDELMGLMVVQSYRSVNAYTPDDLKLLEFVSSQVAISLKRREYESFLHISREKAIESDRLKSAFLANMSHEIRTPMNSIVGFSDLITRDTIGIERKSLYARYISNSSKALLALIDDIIDIAKIEAGQLKILKSSVSVNKIINELFDFFHSEQIRDSKDTIELRTHFAVDGNNFAILCDMVRLRQVLNNLINNALKFTTSGFVEFGYVIPNNATIIFYVQDTGIGIAREKQAVIFERFRQVDDTTTRKYGGTGLGLAISKKLVELMGGKIWVESEASKGSTFYFSLPLIIPNSSETVIGKNPSKHRSENFKGETILVAEDEDLNFLFLQEVLSFTQAKIIRACNGQEAIDLVKENPNITLVLMDIQMPLLNGYVATQEITRIKPELPVIVQTAYAMAEDRAKGFRAGCRDYISKPIKPEELIDILKKHIAKKNE
jgi:signal transduction histidine kinase/ActR/RegA family two-component response regulator